MDDRISQLFDIADWFTQAQMLWWVSSTAVVGTLLGSVWWKRKELASERGVAWAVFGVGAAFLVSIVIYGVVVDIAAFHLGDAGKAACRAAAPKGCDLLGEGQVFYLLPPALTVGVSSFVLALGAWLWIGGQKLLRAQP